MNAEYVFLEATADVIATAAHGAQNSHCPPRETCMGARLVMDDAVHLAEDGFLKVLWDSERWNIQFLFNKFDPPVIDGGQIYVPNYNGGVDVYRLTP